jgi:hypothetical protein
MSFSRGDDVERCIEGLWFLARVLSVNFKEENAKLQYIDDNNVEEAVPFEDLRPIAPGSSSSGSSSDSKHSENRDSKNSSDSKGFPSSSASAASKEVQRSLMKPLAGLVDDDFEARAKIQPKVYIHDSKGSKDAEDESLEDSSIILNGAENRLAAGGGLRAIRGLRS